MESVEKLLLTLGLAKSEAQIYLFGLEKRTLGVEEVQKGTKLKAPTVYHALTQLESKGLVTRQRTEGKLLYNFAGPELLDELISKQHAELRQKSDELTKLMPLFPQVLQNHPQFHTESFSGHDQVRKAIDLALFCQSKQWDILAPAKNYLAESDEPYIRYFKNMRVRNEITSRSLWESKVGKGPLSLSDLVSRKPRYLNERYKGQLKSMMILFEDSTLLIGSHATPVALLYRSSEFTAMMRLLFDGLWRDGTKER